MSLVLELQAEAIDGNAGVDQLLRKALAVAMKLNLSEFKTWIDLELNGYSSKEVPDYRVMQGELLCRNPVRGLIPFLVESPDLEAVLRTRYEPAPIGVIQQAVRTSTQSNSHFIANFPQEVVLQLLKGQSHAPMIPCLRLNINAYIKILNAVRNNILEWSLKLERDGILGEGLSFTTKEKEIAHKKQKELRPEFNIINIQNMINSQLQQASAQANQS